MRTKEEFFSKLYASPMYVAARAALKTDAERAQLDAFMRAKFGSVAEALTGAIAQLEDDPNAKNELLVALRGSDRVVIHEASVSGSRG